VSDLKSQLDSLPLAPLTDAQKLKLEAYLEQLLSATQEMNLTAIVEREEAWNRHIVESLRLLPLLEDEFGASHGQERVQARRLIDVGSGGGLPGMVIAIMRPDLAVTLLEATEKKARFLERTGMLLGLANLSVISERAEDAAKSGSALRESFDMVTARAVAPLRVLLELTVPFLRVSGLLVAVKGERAESELNDAQVALELLGTRLESSHRQPTATVLRLRKTQVTLGKYPRRPGEPKRNPL
jgi:16S rRNA (guanine527-N7)-methyltransferase